MSKTAMQAAVEALEGFAHMKPHQIPRGFSSTVWSEKLTAARSALSLLRSALEEGEEPVAWLVTGGRTYVDKAYTKEAHAHLSLTERQDGARIVPLYASPITADKED